MKRYLSVFLAVLFIVPVGVMQSFAADRVDYVITNPYKSVNCVD